MINVPPYCGVPRLSHQCPVVEVDVVTVVVVVADDVTAVEVLEDVTVVEAVVEVVVLVVVDLLQDANTSDARMR